tara:strand:+ start:1699 stop:2067 length:369 start_codon:yes stop_codon:yes gene_type:complete
MNIDLNYDNFFTNMLELLLLHENKVISIKGKKLLKKEKYKKENNEYCPITLDSFKENEDIIILPCNHKFKEEPINKWLKEESNTCPVCRYELPGTKKYNSSFVLKEEEKVILHETFITSINN